MSDPVKPTEFWTPERCYITELLNHGGSPEVSIARARVEPGVTTLLHSLAGTEIYVIESGKGRMMLGSETPRDVSSGDVVLIPKNVPQKISNLGDDDLVFLCVCAPRFSPERYTSLE
jgi:mannose-6-phosphate isomerase-like protein (cupin superfamily)